MKLQGKKIAIFIESLYQEMEVWVPYYRMKEEGAEILMIGPEKGKEYLSKHGYPATSDLGIDEARAQDFDALIIPGGYAPDYMRRNKAMVRMIKEMAEAGKVVAAICHAGWMLASADVIAGKKVTSVAAIQDDMKHAGADWVDEEVVRDGNIITSRMPDDLPAFCKKLIEALIS